MAEADYDTGVLRENQQRGREMEKGGLAPRQKGGRAYRELVERTEML